MVRKNVTKCHIWGAGLANVSHDIFKDFFRPLGEILKTYFHYDIKICLCPGPRKLKAQKTLKMFLLKLLRAFFPILKSVSSHKVGGGGGSGKMSPCVTGGQGGVKTGGAA